MDTPEGVQGVPDDMRVLGFDVEGWKRVFRVPALELDHVVNTTLEGKPVAITWCLACDSVVVFEASLPDRPRLRLYAHMAWQGSLLLRDAETNSVWRQIDGVCIAGPLRGQQLRMVPGWSIATWGSVKDLEPGVVTSKSESATLQRFRLRDQPVRTDLLTSLRPPQDGVLDNRTDVFGVVSSDEAVALPLADFVTRGLHQGAVGPQAFVVFHIAAPDRPRAFDPHLDGRLLHFQRHPRVKGRFIDLETESVWGPKGAALAGPLAGKQLAPLAGVQVEWYAWRLTHPKTELVREGAQ